MIDQELWKKAAFLHERLNPGPVTDPAGRERAGKKLKTWRDTMMCDDGEYARRLQDAALSEEEFLGHLAREDVAVNERQADFKWLAFLDELAQRKHRDEPLPPLIAPPGPKARPSFAGFTRPFIQVGAARLRQGIAAIRDRHLQGRALLTAEAERSLILGLHEALSVQATRVLVLELNAARLLGELPEGTPQERFDHFLGSFDDAERLLKLLQEYPVLARMMVATVERWVAVGLELLERVAKDREELGRFFLSGQELGEVSALAVGVGDVHRGGRSVAHVKFSAGIQLVYKPRSLDIDAGFQRLLNWLNTHGLSTPHRMLKLLNRGDYGWVEFVKADECTTRDQLQRFYLRQGSLMALLYMLRAVDLHMENLIASGEHPVVVDLEALFYHEPPIDYGQDAYWRAIKLLDQSVLSIGLLPNFQMANGTKSVDLSGLGGQSGQVFPHPVLMVEDAHQDTMRLVRKQVTTRGSNNLPRLAGEPANASEFVEEMARGFEETYQMLVRERASMERELRTFSDVEVRHIVRPTFRYGFLQQESQHPDFLRDALEFERLLDLLWAETRVRPMLGSLVRHEQADLRAGDVPLFSARPGSRNLWTSTGERIADFFAETSLDSVLARLGRMGGADCAEQVSLLRKAMVALEMATDGSTQTEQSESHAPLPPASRDEMYAAAVDIGEYLQRKAVLGETNATWIGASLKDIEDWRWNLAPVRTSLYEGVGGIALFFGYLASATGREDFARTSRAALETVLWFWRNKDDVIDYPGVGAYLGRGSHLYVMSHLATLFDDKALMDEVLAGLPSIDQAIPDDKNVDVLTGSAGCARVMLGLHRLTGDARALESARKCGERILQAAIPLRGGLGFNTIVSPDKPLGGFSHGAAGFSWVLLELAAATGDARFREAALQGLTFERTLFVPERGNWLDLRFMAGDKVKLPSYIPSAWCNGAAGIALGRALSLPFVDDAQMREEIRVGLETTLRQNNTHTRSHSLCHGAMGNIDILCTAADALQEDHWRQEALRHAAQVLKEGREEQWRCGLPKFNETPGVMLGLAGIGLAFLKLSSPGFVPSVMSLEPARARSGTRT